MRSHEVKKGVCGIIVQQKYQQVVQQQLSYQSGVIASNEFLMIPMKLSYNYKILFRLHKWTKGLVVVVNDTEVRLLNSSLLLEKAC